MKPDSADIALLSSHAAQLQSVPTNQIRTTQSSTSAGAFIISAPNIKTIKQPTPLFIPTTHCKLSITRLFKPITHYKILITRLFAPITPLSAAITRVNSSITRLNLAITCMSNPITHQSASITPYSKTDF